MTTGDLRSIELLNEEEGVRLPEFSNEVAIKIGEIATEVGLSRKLAIAIEIRIGDWSVFKAALPGSKPENDGWLIRKSRVVQLTQHSTMYERVKAEEQGIDWHHIHNVQDETHAIHGGGIPLVTIDGRFHGALLISGLPQVEDHKLGIEILKLFLTR